MGGAPAAGAVLWPNGGLAAPIFYRNASGGFRWTSAFGMRTHPVTGEPETFHYGLDMIGWSTIVAPVNGVVTFAGYNGGAGNEVRIREDGTGDVFRLLHNRELWVRTGQRVGQGQGVAVMGTTGSSTGVHCHEETRPGGGAAIDPLVYYAARNRITPPTPAPDPEIEELEMNTVVYWTRADGQVVYALINTASGYVSLWTGSDTNYNTRMAAGFRTGNFVPITESHANNLIASANAVREAQAA